MRQLNFILPIIVILQINLTSGQTAIMDTSPFPTISKAPVCYRINDSGGKLHGYYPKAYHLIIYGDETLIGYRADCDSDDDWSGAKVSGTTQASNSFESTFGCTFNPHLLYGTVLPGYKSGQKHFDQLQKHSVGTGDLTITYKLDKNNKIIDSVIGVVFDRGPQTQPGESSVATCSKFKSNLDDNLFIYLIFPNSAKYLQRIIGTGLPSKKLKRSPENVDFEDAYKLMMSEVNLQKTKQKPDELLHYLNQFPVISNFDHASSQEKAEGLLKPKNDDRNLND